jgi:hypothetical protein
VIVDRNYLQRFIEIVECPIELVPSVVNMRNPSSGPCLGINDSTCLADGMRSLELVERTTAHVREINLQPRSEVDPSRHAWIGFGAVLGLQSLE